MQRLCHLSNNCYGSQCNRSDFIVTCNYCRSCFAGCDAAYSSLFSLFVFIVSNDGLFVVQLPNVYSYTRVVELNLVALESIRVSGKLSTDLNIGLTQNPDDYTANTMYEIVIGG